MSLGHVSYSAFQPIPKKQAKKTIPALQSTIDLKYYHTASGLSNYKHNRTLITTFYLPDNDYINIYYSKRLQWTIYDGGAWIYYDDKLKCTVLWRINDKQLFFLSKHEVLKTSHYPVTVENVNQLREQVRKNFL